MAQHQPRFSWWPTFVMATLYVGSVLLFTTSMLSTTTLIRTVATEPCGGTGVPPVDQVVLILIDALRPDFVLSSLRPFARTAGHCTDHEDVLKDRRFGEVDTRPTLRYIEDSLHSSSSASVAFFLVADAPTTTMQRIKAISTGTMPAFLEAGSNFNSEALELDSIVGQMNGSAVLLGDDTWEKLFPNVPGRRIWKKAVGIPSLDVADFHTNDDSVLSEVYSVLKAETREGVSRPGVAFHAGAQEQEGHAQLVVAHFLGVDHIGHRIDADNPFMDAKILQLNQMLWNLSTTLRERATSMNTMLLVLGDHGMTNSGDHGGDSVQETDTFLFAEYFPGTRAHTTHTNPLSSHNANLARAQHLIEKRWQDSFNAELNRLRDCHARAGVPLNRLGATYQVDLTATIAVLLGKPIPYANFGRVIPEVLVLANASANTGAAEQCNLRQLQRYFNESGMNVPRDASWMKPGMSVAQQLADMSFYARRSRTDMDRSGMFLGSTGLLLSAMSLLWSPTVRAYLLPGSGAGWVMRWTALTVVLRLCLVFSNSFVVNEDSVLLGLLSSLLVFLIVPRLRVWLAPRRANEVRQAGSDGSGFTTAQPLVHLTGAGVAPCVDVDVQRETIFLAVFLVGLRVAVPMLLRFRHPITNTVDSESALDRALLEGLGGVRFERAGIIVGGIAWSLLYPNYIRRSAVAVTCLCLALVYHVPIYHHAVPLLCIAAYSLARNRAGSPTVLKGRARRPKGLLAASPGHAPYAYLVTVLWLSSLCNERVTTAVVVALYGTTLPFLCSVLRVEPVMTQVVVLHLAAFVAFFAEGHQCMLNTIDWNSSFVGMPGYNLYGGGLLVLSRTFHTFLLVPFALRVWGGADTECCEAEWKDHPTATVPLSRPAPQAAVSTSVVIAAYTHFLLAQSAVSCLSGYVNKNHLMFFPIFCPKLVFDGVISILTCAAALVALMFPSCPPPLSYMAHFPEYVK